MADSGSSCSAHFFSEMASCKASTSLHASSHLYDQSGCPSLTRTRRTVTPVHAQAREENGFEFARQIL